jgi:hypothetical protein
MMIITKCLPRQVEHHVKHINALAAKLERGEAKCEQYKVAIGQHVRAIKAEHEDWEAIVRDRCNLGRSRAYELMAIADGTKTDEQVRGQANVRKIKHRKSVRSGTDEDADTETEQGGGSDETADAGDDAEAGPAPEAKANKRAETSYDRNARQGFLKDCNDAAICAEDYKGPIDDEVLRACRRVADAWAKLADELEREAAAPAEAA